MLNKPSKVPHSAMVKDQGCLGAFRNYQHLNECIKHPSNPSKNVLRRHFSSFSSFSEISSSENPVNILFLHYKQDSEIAKSH